MSDGFRINPHRWESLEEERTKRREKENKTKQKMPKWKTRCPLPSPSPHLSLPPLPPYLLPSFPTPFPSPGNGVGERRPVMSRTALFSQTIHPHLRGFPSPSNRGSCYVLVVCVLWLIASFLPRRTHTASPCTHTHTHKHKVHWCSRWTKGGCACGM